MLKKQKYLRTMLSIVATTQTPGHASRSPNRTQYTVDTLIAFALKANC